MSNRPAREARSKAGLRSLAAAVGLHLAAAGVITLASAGGDRGHGPPIVGVTLVAKAPSVAAGAGSPHRSSDSDARLDALSERISEAQPSSRTTAGRSAAGRDGAEVLSAADRDESLFGPAARDVDDPYARAAFDPVATRDRIAQDRIALQAATCLRNDGGQATITAVVELRLSADGRIVGTPRVLSQVGDTADPRRLESRILEALRECGPYSTARGASQASTFRIHVNGG